MFGDEADSRGLPHFDTHFACLVEGANLCALLTALLGLALIGIDNGDSKFFV